MAAEKTIKELNKLHEDAEGVDREIFAEQRSNVLLVSGEHYTRRRSKYWNRVRDSKDLTVDQKLRLTKNHIQKITKTYINNIISLSPGVAILPNNESEIQDRKSAELNDSVWQYLKKKNNIKLKIQQWCKDYIDIGEVAVKIFWDPNAGKFLGHRAKMDEMGQPVLDDQGQMVPDEPVFSGDLVYERVFGANLRRDPGAKSMEDAKWLEIIKMVRVDELKEMVEGDEDKTKMIQESTDETFIVFDGNQQNYSQTKDQTMLREFYFKPCAEYPNGYFYIAVQSGILFEGELPFGLFPIVYQGFDEIQTSARGRSIVKLLRPYQIEINRAGSKIAEHQVTLGDDKIISSPGAKMTRGVDMPGVRNIQVSGPPPTILAGRSGEQYFAYLQAQISEMYEVSNISEDSEVKEGADPFAQLFASIKNKKKFIIYAEKFEYFLKDICFLSLELGKNYFTEDMLIPMIGRNEYVNISEFKTTKDLCYSIKCEPRVDDIDTMMGKQMVLNQIIQYAGGKLSPDQLGKLIRVMPFADVDEAVSDLTMNFDATENMLLALDRGEQPSVLKYVDPEYVLKRLTSRQVKADYKLLSDQIKNNYDMLIQLYEMQKAKQMQDIQQAQSGFIPSGGARIKVDYYVPDPSNKDRSVRATLPAEAIDWIIQKLAQQGSAQATMSELPQGAQSDIAQKFNQAQQQPMNNYANMQRLAHPGGMGPQQQVNPNLVGNGRPLVPNQENVRGRTL